MSSPATHGGPHAESRLQACAPARARCAGRRASRVGLGSASGLGVGLTVALAVHLHYKNQIAAQLEPVPVAAQAPASANGHGRAPWWPAKADPRPAGLRLLRHAAEAGSGRGQKSDVAVSEGHAVGCRPGDVVLQAGSFKQATEAEKMVAQLALAGVESKVQRASVQDETWYRVRIGPIATVAGVERDAHQIGRSGDFHNAGDAGGRRAPALIR